jgi:hypothetical protein
MHGSSVCYQQTFLSHFNQLIVRFYRASLVLSPQLSIQYVTLMEKLALESLCYKCFSLPLSLSVHWLFTSIRVSEWVSKRASVWFSWWKLHFLCYHRTSIVTQPQACFQWKPRENLSNDIVTGGSYHYETIKRCLLVGRYCSFWICR